MIILSTQIIERNLFNHNIFFVIPSWGKLLGYPTLGSYVNHNISEISQDLVIFLGGMEATLSTEKGTLYYLFGLGYYYVKFELQSGRYITDNRQLTGLILNDFVYDHLATSKNITLENDRDVIVSENLFKLPIDMSFKSENKITFIQGTLMRNLFIPYKHIFLEFMETVRDPKTFQINRSGHMLLSTERESYNKILISGDMTYEPKASYLNPTAGLHEINYGADRHLYDNFTELEIKKIKETIIKLKILYSTIDYDPMFLFSIIENSSPLLKSSKSFSFNLDGDRTDKKMPKESIFISAENRLNSFKEWPLEFKRQTKEQLESSAGQVKAKLYQPQEQEKLKEPKVLGFQKKEETFVPRTLKHPFIEKKPLPYIPNNNVLEILMTLKKIVEGNYELNTIGKAFDIARNNIKKKVLHENYLWDISKYANIYQRSEPNIGLSSKEKREILIEIDKWVKIAIDHSDKL
ncbi:MAG: hypothetical protein ACFE8B_17375 [Candidatus Hermodarchaeota archaeon]